VARGGSKAQAPCFWADGRRRCWETIAQGTNHVLPTYGYAPRIADFRVLDFVKRVTVQEVSVEGLRNLGPTAVTLAELEGLDGHAYSVTRRLELLERASVATS